MGSPNLICFSNLGAVLAGKDPQAKYDGYTSCPLVTGRKTCVLAEFDFQVKKSGLAIRIRFGLIRQF